MKSLLDSAQAVHDELVNDIIGLVRVETHSYDLTALARGLEHIRALADTRLGGASEAQIFDGADDGRGSVLQLTYPGTGAGQVLVIAHYDTVWPTGTSANWGAAEGTDDAGRAILSGPGIFDMKTGLIQGLWALRLLRDSGRSTPSVTFLFNGDEETGSEFSRPYIEAAASEANAVLVLEPTAAGAVKTGRKGVGIFRMTTTGIEAHAGLDPAAGASAVHAMAEAISACTGFAAPSKGTSINVGLVRGGSGSNVSAGHAEAVIDIRVENQDEMDRVDADFSALTVTDPRVDLDVEHYWNRPPMTQSNDEGRLFEVVSEAAASFGHDLAEASVGGGSDANFVAALGIPVVCGMGAVGDGAHARHEFIYPERIPLYTAITAETLARLARGGLRPGA